MAEYSYDYADFTDRYSDASIGEPLSPMPADVAKTLGISREEYRLTTPITEEATRAVDKAVGDTDDQNWLVKTCLGIKNALGAAVDYAGNVASEIKEDPTKLASYAGSAALAVAESPYAVGDSLAGLFGARPGLKDMVRKDLKDSGWARGFAEAAERGEKDNPVAYGLTQAIAEIATTGIPTSAAVKSSLGKFVQWRMAKGAGKVSPFIHGLADSIGVERGTAGAKGVYEAFATSNQALGWGYKSGHIAHKVADAVAVDAASFGTWGVEEDRATGELIKNWGAIPGSLGFDTAVAGIPAMWAANKAISRARVAVYEKRFADARKILMDQNAFWAQKVGTQYAPDGNVARDFLMYEVMKPVTDARVRGQATINLRKSLGEVLEGGMDAVDEQYMERMLQWAYQDMSNLGTMQYGALRPATIADLSNEAYAGNRFAYIDTRSAKAVEEARTVATEEKISEFLRTHKGSHRDTIPESEMAKIRAAVDEKIPEYAGFSPVFSDVVSTMPPDGDYIKLVRISDTKTPMSLSAGLGRQSAVLKVKLQEAVQNSLLAGVEKDIPELVGGLSEHTMGMLENLGRTADYPIKGRFVFSTARRETVTDPVMSKALNYGELNNNVAKSVAHNVGVKHDGIRKLMASLRKNTEASAAYYAELGRMYDSAGNLGWDIKGLVKTDKGVAFELMDTPYNRLKAQQIGYDLEATAYNAGSGKPILLMPDAQTILDNPMPAYTQNKDVIETLQTIVKVEQDITNLREIGRMHGDPISSATTAIHFRKPQTPGEHIYRVFKRESYGDQLDHIAFPNEESARRFLQQRAQAGDMSWSQDVVRGGVEYGQVQGLEMQTYDILRNTTGEHARGFWQGNMTRASENLLVDVLQQQTASATTAARTAVASSLNNAVRMLAGTMSEEAYQEMRQLIRGIVPKNPVLQKLDDMAEACFERLFGYGRADKKVLSDEDLMHVIPNKQAYSASQALQKHGTLVNYALYAVGNVTGTITNILSYIPQMATTGAWMRKMTGESVEEYARRVGIDGMTELAKQGLQPRYTLGLKTIKNLGNKQWRKLVHELADAESIKIDQADDIAKFLDPLFDTSWWHKPVKALSMPISYSERMSRFMAFATWFTYAQDGLKMQVPTASKWAARMTEEAMAAYTPAARLGATNNAIAQAMMMFKGTMTNMLMKNLDMIADQQYRRIAVANIINMYLFGAKTAPFVADYQTTHQLEDRTAANMQYELGAWASMPWFMAPAVGRKMELRGSELLTGLEGSAAVSFARDTGKTAYNLGAAAAQQKGWQFAAEEVASGIPFTLVRNLTSAGLGYTVSQDHKIIEDAPDMQSTVAMALGLQSARDAMLRNINVVQRTNEMRKATANKAIRQKFMAMVRGGKPGNEVWAELLRTFGGDVNALVAAVPGLYAEARDSRGRKFRNDIIKTLLSDPTKVDKFQLSILDLLLSEDTDAR